MKSIFKFILLALVLVMVAMVSALTAMRYAIHGHEVAVPNLAGMTTADAERASLASGLQMDVEREYYSPKVPVGKIMSQVPEAGTKVRRGWQVRVAQSLGPQRVAIPDVTGESSRAAQLNIARRGLDVGSVAILPLADTTADTVLAQSPPPNAREVAAPRISLLVAATPDPVAYLMPNFVGQPLGTVKQILQSSAIRLGTVTVIDPGQPAVPPSAAAGGQIPALGPEGQPSPSSLILSQDPAAGQKITAGSPANFEVSR